MDFAVLIPAFASYLGIQFLTSRFYTATVPAKVIVESLLFFVSFAVQRMLIFRKRGGGGPVAHRLLGPLVLAVMAALVVVEWQGFRDTSVLRQQVWTRIGQARFAQFAGLYAAFSAAILILTPWAFAALAAVSLAVLTAIFAGPQAFCAVAFFLLSAWCLGRLIMRSATSDPLRLLAGVSVYLFLMPFAARLPINYPLVYIATLAVPVALEWRSLASELPRLLRLPFTIELRTWGERAAFAAIVFLVTAHWFATLKPDTGADSLSMHLAVIANIAGNHILTFEPARFLWAVMPMGADFIFSIVYVLGGESAARLANFVVMMVLLGLIYSVARPRVSRGVAYFLVALFASTPMVQMATGSLFVENLLAALLLGSLAAVWKFGDTGDRRFLYVAAILAGSAISTKAGAIAFVAVALPVAALELHRLATPAARAALIAIALLLVAAAPPYAIAWAKTGNPLFPFLNDKFHSPLLPENTSIRDARFRQPLTWSTPFDLTFYSNRFYEGQDGSFGFQYLVLAPLALIALMIAGRHAKGAAIVALGSSLAILSSEPNARYLYASLPLLYIPFGELLTWAADRQRLLFRVLLALSAACLALNAWFLPAASFDNRDFYSTFTEKQQQAYLRQRVPIRKTILWFNATHPGAPVLLTQDSYIAGLTGDVYENHWHQLTTMDRLRRAGDVAGVRRLLDEWKVQFLIARRPPDGLRVKPPVLLDFLVRCTAIEFAAGEFYVARVIPSCAAPAVTTTPQAPLVTAGPGVFDDLDPYILFRGDWDRGEVFPEAYARTVSYTDVPGAEAVFAFRGSAVTWVFSRAHNRGIATVTIDGVDKGSFDLYSKDVVWQSRLRFDGLDAGPHLLLIRVTGKSRPEAQGHLVDIDSFEVKP